MPEKVDLKYTSVEDLELVMSKEKLAQLTDTRENIPHGEDQVDETVANRYLGFAESLVTGYVSGLYSVPLQPAPQAFIYAILVVARRALESKNGRASEEDTEYASTMSWLAAVREGEVELPALGTAADNWAKAGIADNDTAVFRNPPFEA